MGEWDSADGQEWAGAGPWLRMQPSLEILLFEHPLNSS